MLLCTSFDGAISMKTADRLHTRDVNGQTAATVPPPGNGDAQREPRLLLQAHSFLLAGKPTGRILHEQLDKYQAMTNILINITVLFFFNNAGLVQNAIFH